MTTMLALIIALQATPIPRDPLVTELAAAQARVAALEAQVAEMANDWYAREYVRDTDGTLRLRPPVVEEPEPAREPWTWESLTTGTTGGGVLGVLALLGWQWWRGRKEAAQ